MFGWVVQHVGLFPVKSADMWPRQSCGWRLVPDAFNCVWPGPGVDADEDDGHQVEEDGERHEGGVSSEPHVLTTNLPTLAHSHRLLRSADVLF